MKATKKEISCFKFPLLILFFTYINLFTCFSQPTDSLIIFADKLYSEGSFKKAAGIYEQILKENAKSIPALKGLAKSLYSQNNFSKGRDMMEKAMLLDTANIELRYFNAVMNRDIFEYLSSTGTKSLFAVDESYEKAGFNFKWIMQRDSLYKDVLYQYSLFCRFKKDYEDALKYNLRQIELKPLDYENYCGLRRNFTTAFKDYSHSKLKRFIEGVKGDIKEFLLGEYKRLDEDDDEAIEIFENMLKKNSSVPKPLIYTSLFRLYSAKYKSDKFQEFYWKCLSEMKKKSGQEIIFEDIKYLATVEEITEFNSIEDWEKAGNYFSMFWNKRNPSPLLNTNPRMLEHYKRIVFAEKKYAYDKERFLFLKDVDSYFLNREFTDQGFIYIRHGAPDDKSMASYSSLSEGTGTMTDKEALDRGDEVFKSDYEYTTNESILTKGQLLNTKTTGYPLCESWLYKATKENERLIFFFVGGEKQLVPVVFDKHILENIEGWDKDFSNFLFATNADIVEAHNNSRPEDKTDVQTRMRFEKGASREVTINRIYNKGIKSIKNGMVQERSAWVNNITNLRLSNDIYTFRGEFDKTSLELAFIIPTSEIFSKAPDTCKSIKIEAGYGIYDKNWNIMLVKTDTMNIKKPKENNDQYLKMLHLDIDPDSTGISLFYHPLGTEIYGNYKIPKRIRDYSKPGLNISDIMVTGKIELATEENIFNKRGLKIIPLITDRYAIDNPLNIYFEIYNLKKNSDGKTMYLIEYTIRYLGEDQNIISSLLGKGKSNSISTEYNRAGTSEFSAEHISFDINKLIPGKYELEVKVRDINGRLSEKRIREIEVYEPENK
jgi:hypothetical protein